MLIDTSRTASRTAFQVATAAVTAAVGSVWIDTGIPLAPKPFPPESLDGLHLLGHTVIGPANIGSVQMIVIYPRTGQQYGDADFRREGAVIGPRHCRGRWGGRGGIDHEE